MEIEYYNEMTHRNFRLLVEKLSNDKYLYKLFEDGKLIREVKSCKPARINNKTNAYSLLKHMINSENDYTKLGVYNRASLLIQELIEQEDAETENPLYIALCNLLIVPPAELISKANESLESVKELYKEYRLRNTNTTEKYFFTTSDLNWRLKDNTYYKNIVDIDSELLNLYEQGLLCMLNYIYKSRGKYFTVYYLTEQGID